MSSARYISNRRAQEGRMKKTAPPSRRRRLKRDDSTPPQDRPGIGKAFTGSITIYIKSFDRFVHARIQEAAQPDRMMLGRVARAACFPAWMNSNRLKTRRRLGIWGVVAGSITRYINKFDRIAHARPQAAAQPDRVGLGRVVRASCSLPVTLLLRPCNGPCYGPVIFLVTETHADGCIPTTP